MAERITGHTELIGLMAYPIRHSWTSSHRLQKWLAQLTQS